MAPDLTEQIKRPLAGSRFFAMGAPIVVATSTGVDSMVLLALLQEVVPPARLIVAHFNHRLRAQSETEAAFLRQYCQERALRVEIGHWAHPRANEAAARQARYAFLAQVMRQTGAKLLVTAHHANDQAETILMKLVRGGDLHQLVGLQERRPFAGGELVRPLLGVSKATLQAWAKQHALQWFEDATNADLTITRNRYRHQYLPLLQQENPQLVRQLADFAGQLTDLLADEQAHLDQQLLMMAKDNHLDLTAWWACSAPNQRQLLRRWLNQQGVMALKQTSLQQLQKRLAPAARPNQVFTLPGQWCLVRNYQELRLENQKNLAPEGLLGPESMVKFAQWQVVTPTWRAMVLPVGTPPPLQGRIVATMWLPNAALPLVWRPARPTDRLRLKGGGHQTVRRIWINQKIAPADRRQARVLVDQLGRVLWLVGVKTAWWDWPPATSAGQAVQLIQGRVEEHE